MKFINKLENTLLKWIDYFYRIWPQPFPGKESLTDCKVISHRGEFDNENVFENTLSAFETAMEAGVWGIELDLRWTQDMHPVVIHDPDLRRVFGLSLEIDKVTFMELKARCPLIPSLKEVVQRYGRTLHLMLEIKAEHYPEPDHQNQVLKDIFAPLRPQADFHILTLVPQMFQIINFVPKSTFIPIAQLNFSQISKLALNENYRGMAGHYLLLTKALLERHFKQQQKVGTGYIGSKNCLFRELNRGVEWIFSNNAAELQKIVHHLLRSH